MIDYSLIDDWYGNIIPNRFEDKTMLEFCFKSEQFLRIVQRDSEARLKIDSEAQTAYTDGLDCYIPALFFTQQFYDYLGIAKKQEQIRACIAVINGCQLHESLHIKILGKDKCDIRKLIGDNDEFRNYHNQEFYAIFNIVEDQFSENWFIQSNPFYGRFVTLLQKIIFNDYIFKQNLEEYSKGSHYNFKRINLLTSYRNADNQEFPDNLIKRAVNVFYKSNNIHLDIYGRLSISKEIFDLLINRDQIQDGEYNSLIDENGFNNQTLNRICSILEDNNTLEKIQALSENIHTEQRIKMDVIFKDVGELPSHGQLVTNDENFRNFAEFLKFAKSLKHAPTMPKEIGSKISNNLIHRIATDNKIFRQRTNDHLKRGEPEIIVLIDLSFSMVSSNLIESVVKASKSIFESLYQAGLSIAVYGHTTYYDSAVVYAIAANNMPFLNKTITSTHDYVNRFERILNVDSSANADGFAIQFLASHFSEKQGDKAIIVLSDGRPSASNYNDESAIEHTKSVVKNLRDSNITVLSLSLIERVMENNNDIYGDGNIQAWGNMLETNFRKAVSQIIKRGN